MLFIHGLQFYLDDGVGGGCMMELMRELKSRGAATAEHCVRKTTGGGRKEFLLKTWHLQTHRHTRTCTHMHTQKTTC